VNWTLILPAVEEADRLEKERLEAVTRLFDKVVLALLPSLISSAPLLMPNRVAVGVDVANDNMVADVLVAGYIMYSELRAV